jgi:hypothetical protein
MPICAARKNAARMTSEAIAVDVEWATGPLSGSESAAMKPDAALTLC